ncbi:TraC family protein [Xanthobacter sp. V13C-7B]|uniref:TraC family protein n=1 Tax=Xanthobacter variabilis TaxID=3119932 RepID=UPI00372A3EE0
MARARSARRSTAISDIDAQIIELQKRRKELQDREAARIGKLAIAAGLAELNLDDDLIKAAFADVMSRFQSGETRAAQPGAGAPASGEDREPAAGEQDSAEPVQA